MCIFIFYVLFSVDTLELLQDGIVILDSADGENNYASTGKEQVINCIRDVVADADAVGGNNPLLTHTHTKLI